MLGICSLSSNPILLFCKVKEFLFQSEMKWNNLLPHLCVLFELLSLMNRMLSILAR